MANWADVVGYVKQNHKVEESDDKKMVLLYQTTGSRSQVVFLWRQKLMDEEWVEIESPVGDVDTIDLASALQEAGQLVCGGLITTDGVVTIRHSAPLPNLDTNEIEHPLEAIVASADMLEKSLTGGDKY